MTMYTNLMKQMAVQNLISKSALMKLQLSVTVDMNFVINKKKIDVYIIQNCHEK
jgi:hypothetical protein